MERSEESPLEILKLGQPIRYSEFDNIEQWLYKFLCLRSTEATTLNQPAPNVNQCQLYAVNKNTLFASTKVSDKFLDILISLFLQSHYKN